MEALLEIRGSPSLLFRLERGVTRIGRAADNSVQLSDPSVSSYHCEVAVETDRVVIQDLNSTNGTFVSGQRIQTIVATWNQPFVETNGTGRSGQLGGSGSDQPSETFQWELNGSTLIIKPPNTPGGIQVQFTNQNQLCVFVEKASLRGNLVYKPARLN